MNEQAAELRKLIYAGGVALIIIGLIFAVGTVFHVFGAESETAVQTQLGQPLAIDAPRRPDPFLLVLDFVLIAGGGMMMKYGGSGASVVDSTLDQQPQKTKTKWNSGIDRAFTDAVSHSSDMIDAFQHDDKPPATIVKVRCLQCRTLNDESAKFCNECGKPMA